MSMREAMATARPELRFFERDGEEWFLEPEPLALYLDLDCEGDDPDDASFACGERAVWEAKSYDSDGLGYTTRCTRCMRAFSGLELMEVTR